MVVPAEYAAAYPLKFGIAKVGTEANQLAHLSAQFRTANRSSTTRFGHIFYKRGNAVSGAQQIQTTPLHWLPADIRSLPTHYANQIAVIVGP